MCVGSLFSLCAEVCFKSYVCGGVFKLRGQVPHRSALARPYAGLFFSLTCITPPPHPHPLPPQHLQPHTHHGGSGGFEGGNGDFMVILWAFCGGFVAVCGGFLVVFW